MNLTKTKKVVEFANEYHKFISKIEHKRIDGKEVCFYANNSQIAPYLQSNFTKKKFADLFKLCMQNNVFDLRFFNHIPNVTFNAAAKHMTRKWPRDHMGMIPLIEDLYPDELWNGLEEWAKVYNQPREIKGFEKVWQNPKSACFNHGVAHTFWQKSDGSLRRDSGWKMHQRIESHGELLKYLAHYARLRLAKETNLSEDVIKTIVRFTHYLCVQGVSPQSCGAWEEIPFKNGINWDNVSVMQAFSEVVLLINELQKHQEDYAKIKHFEQSLCKKFNLPSLFTDTVKLSKFVKESLKQIRHFYMDEFRGATKRDDACSVMLAAEGIDLSANGKLETNLCKHLNILHRFERKLLHEFGAWRYNRFSTEVDGKKVTSCDSYLNMNYYILCDSNGKLCPDKKDADASNKKEDDNGVGHFKRRARNMKEKTSAQWGLPLSYAALAYGKLTALLLDERDKKGNWSKIEKTLFEECFNKNQEFIKRTYANISGCRNNKELFLKADGNFIEPFRKPEAYQAVTSKLNTKEYTFIAGVNDHLGWDAAKCYEASKLFLENLKRIENQTL